LLSFCGNLLEDLRVNFIRFAKYITKWNTSILSLLANFNRRLMARTANNIWHFWQLIEPPIETLISDQFDCNSSWIASAANSCNLLPFLPPLPLLSGRKCMFVTIWAHFTLTGIEALWQTLIGEYYIARNLRRLGQFAVNCKANNNSKS